MKSKIAFTADVSFLKNNKDLFFNQNEYNKSIQQKCITIEKCATKHVFQQKCMQKTFTRKKYTYWKFLHQQRIHH